MTESALDITGSWEYTLDTPAGDVTVYLIVEQQGDQVAAWLANDMLGKVKADDVSVTGDQLKATFPIMGQTSTLDVTFSAEGFTGTHVLPMLTAQVEGRRGSIEDRITAAAEALAAMDRVAIPQRDPEEIAAQVASLLARMTLDEKIGQLVQIHAAGAPTGPGEPPTGPQDLIQAGKVGSLLGMWSPLPVYELQKAAVEGSRLSIPLLFMSDVIHGYKTIYPIPLATACSWDMDAITQAAQMAARECAVSGINVTFAPMLDLVRDPRWGRVMESPGEDAYLGACVAEAFVAGFQGDDWREPAAVGACAKHFVAYGCAAREGVEGLSAGRPGTRRVARSDLPAHGGGPGLLYRRHVLQRGARPVSGDGGRFVGRHSRDGDVHAGLDLGNIGRSTGWSTTQTRRRAVRHPRSGLPVADDRERRKLGLAAPQDRAMGAHRPDPVRGAGRSRHHNPQGQVKAGSPAGKL